MHDNFENHGYDEAVFLLIFSINLHHNVMNEKPFEMPVMHIRKF